MLCCLRGATTRELIDESAGCTSSVLPTAKRTEGINDDCCQGHNKLSKRRIGWSNQRQKVRTAVRVYSDAIQHNQLWLSLLISEALTRSAGALMAAGCHPVDHEFWCPRLHQTHTRWNHSLPAVYLHTCPLITGIQHPPLLGFNPRSLESAYTVVPMPICLSSPPQRCVHACVCLSICHWMAISGAARLITGWLPWKSMLVAAAWHFYLGTITARDWHISDNP